MAYDATKPPSPTNLPPGATWNTTPNALGSQPVQSRAILQAALDWATPQNLANAFGQEDLSPEMAASIRNNVLQGLGYVDGDANAGTFNGRYDTTRKGILDAQKQAYSTENIGGRNYLGVGDVAQDTNALKAGAGGENMLGITLGLMGAGGLAGAGGFLSGGELAGGAGADSLIGGAAADTLGTGAGALPTWAGGAAEGIGGGATGTGLGAASLAGQGLTTAAGVGSGFAGAGAGTLGAAGIDAAASGLPAWAGGAGGTSLGGASSTLDQITKYLTNRGVTPSDALKVAQTLSGGSGSAGAGGVGGVGGGNSMATQSSEPSLLDSILGLGTKTIPSLLAWNYFQNLPKPDTGQYQTLINKAGDMSGPLGQFDINTAAGRGALGSSLAQRGVMGSSFGDQAFTNFDTTRDLGRGNLAFGGIGTQGQLLNSMNNNIIGNNKNNTDFLGRLLGGSGNSLGTNSAGATGGWADFIKSILGNSSAPSLPTGEASPSGGYDNALGLLSGSSNTDWLKSLFGGSTSSTDPYGINNGLVSGASGIGTNNPLASNPLSSWLTGGTNGMASLSNLWGW